MPRSSLKRAKVYFVAILSILLCTTALFRFASATTGSVAKADKSQSKSAASKFIDARPSKNGRLHVEGTHIVDEKGKAVQLRGASTHGLTWYPDFVNQSLFDQVSTDWNANLIRLAMYSTVYCSSEEEQATSLELMKKGIDAAIEADMYVLVDWHILEDDNPNINVGKALEFFEQISTEYAKSPNIIFEICNEPNDMTSWADVLEYAERVIPVIRANMPEAIIVVGTPEYDRNLGDPILRPLDDDNVMYVLHFYAASHHKGLRDELNCAIESGLPIFISECGICEASGDGTTDFASATEWFDYLHKHGIGYAIWSLSNKNESSAFFKTGFNPTSHINDEDLTVSGKWVRELLRGTNPKDIPVPAPVVEKNRVDTFLLFVTESLGFRGFTAVSSWGVFALGSCAFICVSALIGSLYLRRARKRFRTYEDVDKGTMANAKLEERGRRLIARGVIVLSIAASLIYLCWRVVYSIPTEAGFLAITANILLLAVEVLGFVESLIMYAGMLGLRTHRVPNIPDDEYPDVDIFIATYNEPCDLLRRTINGCTHLRYPDPSKVHVWVCDDNRRPEMRALAEEMGVGYFDRPNNEGAKAGNLNHALGLTSAPYVVTLDADMIPRSNFLLETIPYFVDVELKNRDKEPDEQLHLGLLQTPQAFYDPDVFQHALYSENRVPNEQDFFYRTIEPGKASSNSVIYGGSNTVLSRAALEDIGGFFTESITEDFATGLLIESAGYLSLATPEPLASGQTPHTYAEHIQQRTRWGRGVIATVRQLKIWRRKNMSLAQKLSYWSSFIYWYSPIKNLVYMVSPLLFATFGLPVFACNWLELLVFWFPMFILQDIVLRLVSRGAISRKWSGIYETSVMPHLLIPVIKETFGMSMTTFKVTDKSRAGTKRFRDTRFMRPFIVLAVLSIVGIVRVILMLSPLHVMTFVCLLFWLIRNLYLLIMCIFLVDGRDDDLEPVHVRDAIPVIVETLGESGGTYEGVVTKLTEHSLMVFLDEGRGIGIGTRANVTIVDDRYKVKVSGSVVGLRESRKSQACTQTIEIHDFQGNLYEYWQVLYDRIPSLPQSLNLDYGMITHLWQNVVHRIARTAR